MDDVTVYGGSFEECLINFETFLHRYIEKNLVLNWDILFPRKELKLIRKKLR